MKYLTLIPAALLIATQAVFAESPLSARGYGKQIDASSVRASGMGLAAISTPDSLSLDLLTPANWGGLSKTRFGFGTFIGRTTSTDGSGNDASDEGGITGAGLAIHIRKGIFFGMTLTPYTLLEYKWRSTDTLDWATTLTRRQGDGGLSQALIGVSFPVRDNLRIGVAARPIFGKVERLWAVSFTETAANNASQTISDRYAGMGWSLSGSWTDGSWTGGLLLQTPLDADVERQAVVGAGGVAQVDTTVMLTEEIGLPAEVTLGVGRRMGEHLFSSELAWRRWGAVTNTAATGGTLDNATRISAGWEWAPANGPLDPFWRRLVYRAGIYTNDFYALSQSGHQARKTALTLGLGVPYAANKSRLDIAFELAMTGDKAKDGAEETYIGVTIGFNHSETWFVGRKERGK